MSNDTVTIQNISFAYKHSHTQVFSDFSLTVKQNDICCVLGHNGAGKTTLLNLIYGLLRSKTGSISIASSSVQSYRDIFFYSGDSKQNRDLSTRQLIHFRELFFSKACDKEAVERLAGQFNFDRYLDIPIKALSAGNKVRASFIAGVAFQPSLFLLDEPTNSIDPETREYLKDLLQEQKKGNATVLLVTHDLDFAYSVSDRAFVIERGKVVREDDEVSLLKREEFVEQYLRYTAEGNDYD